MQPTPLSVDQYLSICSNLNGKGWTPTGKFGSMQFERNGKTYDLSAADLSQLGRIERDSLFVI